jgi:hypothetical protein
VTCGGMLLRPVGSNPPEADGMVVGSSSPMAWVARCMAVPPAACGLGAVVGIARCRRRMEVEEGSDVWVPHVSFSLAFS